MAACACAQGSGLEHASEKMGFFTRKPMCGLPHPSQWLGLFPPHFPQLQFFFFNRCFIMIILPISFLFRGYHYSLNKTFALLRCNPPPHFVSSVEVANCGQNIWMFSLALPLKKNTGNVSGVFHLFPYNCLPYFFFNFFEIIMITSVLTSLSFL